MRATSINQCNDFYLLVERWLLYNFYHQKYYGCNGIKVFLVLIFVIRQKNELRSKKKNDDGKDT